MTFFVLKKLPKWPFLPFLPLIAYTGLCYQEAQLSLEKANRAAYIRSPASDLQSRRKSELSEVRQFHARYVNGTLSR